MEQTLLGEVGVRSSEDEAYDDGKISLGHNYTNAFDIKWSKAIRITRMLRRKMHHHASFSVISWV